MPDEPRVIFRGVCVYAHKPGSPLVMLYPKTRGQKSGCRKPSKHFALISVFEDGTLVQGPLGFGRRNLEVRSTDSGGDSATSVTADGLINLRSLVKAGVKLTPDRRAGQGNVAASAMVLGGRAVAEDPSDVNFEVPGHPDPWPMHSVSWTPGDGNRISIKSVQVRPTVDLVVGHGQVAYIGHYDDDEDAMRRDRPRRRCRNDGMGPLYDVDFDFLYDLTDMDPADQRVLPKGPPPTDLDPFGARRTPLTSTCFGASWLDE